MHPHLNQLFDIASKPSRTILGVMSGTSLDGLDVALCHIHGAGQQTKIELKAFETIPFDAVYRNQVRQVFASRDANLEQVCILNAWAGRQFASTINRVLESFAVSANDVDCIASHGQTIYHAPQSLHQQFHMPNSTMQIGDGDHIAVGTGIMTISDFRQKHIAAGGEGAPLVSYGDFLLFQHPTQDSVLLNIGGIANATLLPKSCGFSDVFSSDFGPGNTLMDAYIQRQFTSKQYDKGGELASQGKVNKALLNHLLDHPYFSCSLPKTTGQEAFNLGYVDEAINSVESASNSPRIKPPDVLATLCELSAMTIAKGISELVGCSSQAIRKPCVIASGGGVYNLHLMKRLELHLCTRFEKVELQTLETLGFNSDAKEAMLFALLANETLAGHADTFSRSSNKRNSLPAVTMGKISFPD